MKTIVVCLLSAFLLAAAAIHAQEWSVIFDGKSTDALRGYKEKSFPDKVWVIDGDAIKAIAGRGGDIITKETYADFELEMEWKISSGGNSGVMYRVAETNGPAWYSGPEMQVLDDKKHGDGKNPKTSAGALYDLIAPNKDKKLNPVGEWNTAKIVIKNGHVEHWLNGAKVVEYEWDSPEVRALIEQSKFKDMKDFMKEKSGHIAFQHHGDTVWYRNIRIRRL
jgi:hypothetical protein